MKRIFVYGSLRKGCFNNVLLKDSEFIKEATIKGYDMYSLGAYPYITEGKGIVKGEIYDVDYDTYLYLRGMEEGAGYTQNEEMTDDNDEVLTWVYWNKVNDIQVKSGDWKEFSQSRS